MELAPDVYRFPCAQDTLKHVLGLGPDGYAAEFGVARGTTLRLIAEVMPAVGFDSFEGLPSDWRPGFCEGMFACKPPVIANAEIVVGLFENTLPAYDFTRLGSLGLVHVDCDLLSSARTVLHYVGPHLRAGTYIVFDEFHGYPGAGPDVGEWLAWREFVARNDIGFTVIAYGPEQLAVRIEEVSHAGSSES